MIEGPIGFGQGGTFMYRKVDSRIFEDGDCLSTLTMNNSEHLRNVSGCNKFNLG